MTLNVSPFGSVGLAGRHQQKIGQNEYKNVHPGVRQRSQCRIQMSGRLLEVISWPSIRNFLHRFDIGFRSRL